MCDLFYSKQLCLVKNSIKKKNTCESTLGICGFCGGCFFCGGGGSFFSMSLVKPRSWRRFSENDSLGEILSRSFRKRCIVTEVLDIIELITNNLGDVYFSRVFYDEDDVTDSLIQREFLNGIYNLFAFLVNFDYTCTECSEMKNSRNHSFFDCDGDFDCKNEYLQNILKYTKSGNISYTESEKNLQLFLDSVHFSVSDFCKLYSSINVSSRTTIFFDQEWSEASDNYLLTLDMESTNQYELVLEDSLHPGYPSLNVYRSDVTFKGLSQTFVTGPGLIFEVDGDDIVCICENSRGHLVPNTMLFKSHEFFPAWVGYRPNGKIYLFSEGELVERILFFVECQLVDHFPKVLGNIILEYFQ